MVAATLKIIDVWYNEATQGSERPKLLSKLCALELCGWLEVEFDRLVMTAAAGRLDSPWVESAVLKRNNGFTYDDHLRAMLSKLIGEIFVRRIEEKMESDYPGQLDRLRSMLCVLWKARCSFAHADVIANVASQQTFQAPSWSINQHRLLKKFIANYEVCLQNALAAI